MRTSIVWKLVIPMVLIVSLLATGLLWAYLRLVNDAFLRRVPGRVDVVTRAVATHQHHLEARTPDQQESVQHILKGGRHLLALIDEVLDIARPGGTAARRRRVAISDQTARCEAVSRGAGRSPQGA